MDEKIKARMKEFLFETTFENQKSSEADGMPMPTVAKPPREGQTCYGLPAPDILPNVEVNFLELVELRSSVRKYGEKEITAEELSYLLWCTQGVKMPREGGRSFRNVPAAGGRHSAETYFYAQRVEGLPKGIYRYLPYEHAIVLEMEGEEACEEFEAAFLRQAPLVKNSAMTFVWSTVIERLRWKYGARAYRYAFLDAGHICENLYLAAQTVKAGVCAIGAFSDEKLNAALKVDGEEEFVIYAATIGKF